MATTKSSQQDSTPVRIVGKLGEAFERVQEHIRERAYQIFRSREPEAGDSFSDWLEAQLQLVTPVELVVKDQKKNIVVEGNLKGFSPREIEIELDAGQLRVFGSHTESTASGKSAVGTTTSEAACFYQCLSLPCAVVEDQGRAKLLKNGKLTITLPKKVPAK